jgi:hypothetical protein
MVTARVTPWTVRLPRACAVTTCPRFGAEGNPIGWVRSKVAIG